MIDMQRMAQFLPKLQEAAQQAIQRGDVGAAQQYSKLIEQAEKALAPVISGHQPIQAGSPQVQAAPAPAAPPGAAQMTGDPLAPLMPSATAAPTRPQKPITDPVAEHRALMNDPNTQWANTQQDMKQESSPSWTDQIFGGPKNASGPWAQAADQKPNADAPPVMDWMTKPLWGDRDLLFNQKEQQNAIRGVTNWLTEPQWFKEPKGGSYWEVLGQKRPKEAYQPNADLFSPSGSLPPDDTPGTLEYWEKHGGDYPGATAADIAKRGGQASGKGSSNADPYSGGATYEQIANQTPNSVTGQQGNPKGSNWGLADLFGILFGGRNFLQYKAGQEAREADRDFQAKRDDQMRAERRAELEQQLGMREKALAVEYMKNQERAENMDSPEDREYRAVLHMMGNYGVNSKDPFVQEAQNRARAIQLKKNKN